MEERAEKLDSGNCGAHNDGGPACANEVVQAAIRNLKTSKSNEYFTPAKYVDAVRAVLGEIDLDPATCPQANLTVRARRIYTAADDGLKQPWIGRVFLNPPYGGTQGKFVAKLVESHAIGNVTAAIILVSAYATETKWFEPLWPFPLCFVRRRIKFDTPIGKSQSATIGSVFAYLGPGLELFCANFSAFGTIVARI